MKNLKIGIKPIALIGGITLLTIGAAIGYWFVFPQQSCTRVTTGGQEVTYSRGCFKPQRYRKWVITAEAMDCVDCPRSGRKDFATAHHNFYRIVRQYHAGLAHTQGKELECDPVFSPVA